MGNISNREKILIFVLGAALIALIMFLAIIRPLINKNNQAKATLEERRQTDQQYRELIEANSQLEADITKAENSIKDIEGSILPEVETYSVENFIKQTLESKGSPYLSSISSESIPCDEIHLPDGSVASETLVLKRIHVEYASTDGFTVKEYNGQPRFTTDEGLYDEALISELIAGMGNWEDERYSIVGYKEFTDAMEEISKAYPTCVKIHSMSVEDSLIGFLYLRADIDCYATNLGTERLLPENDPKQVKITWSGDTNVACDAGMIGVPIINNTEGNSFYGRVISLKALSDFQNRPYASYFSSAILADIAKNQESLYDDIENKTTFVDGYGSFDGINQPAATQSGEAGDAGENGGDAA